MIKRRVDIETEQDLDEFSGILHDLEVLVPDFKGLELVDENLFDAINTYLWELLDEMGTLYLSIEEIALIAYQIALKFDLEVSSELLGYLDDDSEIQ